MQEAPRRVRWAHLSGSARPAGRQSRACAWHEPPQLVCSQHRIWGIKADRFARAHLDQAGDEREFHGGQLVLLKRLRSAGGSGRGQGVGGGPRRKRALPTELPVATQPRLRPSTRQAGRTHGNRRIAPPAHLPLKHEAAAQVDGGQARGADLGPPLWREGLEGAARDVHQQQTAQQHAHHARQARLLARAGKGPAAGRGAGGGWLSTRWPPPADRRAAGKPYQCCKRRPAACVPTRVRLPHSKCSIQAVGCCSPTPRRRRTRSPRSRSGEPQTARCPAGTRGPGRRKGRRR